MINFKNFLSTSSSSSSLKVGCLADFFGPDFVFIAYGNEKFSQDDFDLTSNGTLFFNWARYFCIMKCPKIYVL